MLDFTPNAVDTCVLVHYFLNDDQGRGGAIEAAAALVNGDAPIVVPAMVAVEIVATPGMRNGQTSGPVENEAIKKAQEFLDSPQVIIVELDGATARLAGEIATKYLVMPPDAAVLASAISAGCEHLYTYDDKLINKVAGITEIKVCHPPAPEIPPLLSSDPGSWS